MIGEQVRAGAGAGLQAAGIGGDHAQAVPAVGLDQGLGAFEQMGVGAPEQFGREAATCLMRQLRSTGLRLMLRALPRHGASLSCRREDVLIVVSKLGG